MAFSPNGTIIASGSSGDRTVKLWDVSEWTHLLNGELAFGFARAVEDQAYTAGTAITALQLPEATGGEGEITYRVSDLPVGLTFDAATRTISGTPEAATDGTVEVTYTAQDSTGAAATLTFSITVNPSLSFGDLFGLLNSGASEKPPQNAVGRPCAPSTGIIAPLIQFARSDTRNATTSATSSGVPKRPAGNSRSTNWAKCSGCSS